MNSRSLRLSLNFKEGISAKIVMGRREVIFRDKQFRNVNANFCHTLSFKVRATL